MNSILMRQIMLKLLKQTIKQLWTPRNVTVLHIRDNKIHTFKDKNNA